MSTPFGSRSLKEQHLGTDRKGLTVELGKAKKYVIIYNNGVWT